jgi:HSP20 family molecular chaperone IbpA
MKPGLPLTTLSKFQRPFLFSLPVVIEEEKVKAKFKDGVLNLYLSKSENAKPKAIEVKVA